MSTTSVGFLKEVNTKLATMLDTQAAALPQDFNKQRFIQNTMSFMQDGKQDFSACKPATVIRTFLRGAFLGLDFFNGECYAIPYGNSCNFQTDYKGEIKLAMKYSSRPIKNIYARLVREGDAFEETIVNGEMSFNYTPKPFNNGDVLGAFGVIIYKDGTVTYDTMSIGEILDIKNKYANRNSPAWTKSPTEMYKKTMIRRILKTVTLEFDNGEQNAAYVESIDETPDDDEPLEAFDALAESKPKKRGRKKKSETETAAAVDVEAVEMETLTDDNFDNYFNVPESEQGELPFQ